MFLKKYNAMTLVELILVLGIIGVLAMVCIPSMRKHSQKTELGALAQKAYTTLEQAVDNAILTEGPVRRWDFTSTSTFCSKYLVPNMNLLSQNCSDDSNSVVTRDNIKFIIQKCENTVCKIRVDVNNNIRPNMQGKDMFEFQIDKGAEKVIPTSWGGTDTLWKNGWEFTEQLWQKTW